MSTTTATAPTTGWNDARAKFPTAFALATVLLALPVQQPVSAQVLAGAPRVNVARLDHGLKARALADGVYVVGPADAR